jgi:hypothetical protein
MAKTEQIILEFDVDVDQSIESIESLTKANKALREERNKLNLSTEQGKKRAQEINAVIDQNTSKIKSNVSAIEQQKINIGNYKSALDGVHPALGKLGTGLEQGTSGFKAMTTQALRFIATPIGAILAAIVAVFTLLKTAISTNNELLDKFENITNAVGVVLEVIVGRIGKLGEALIALASGNFSEAVDLTSQAFSGLASEIENAVRQQQLFLDASRELEDSQRALRIEAARQENVIRQLVVAAKNRNLTFDEQEDKLRQALALEQQLVDKREDIARRDLVITARTTRANAEFQQQENENFEQYLNRLITGGKLRDEEVDKIVDKIEVLEQARGSSLAFQEKVENSLAAIQEKRAEALKKQNEALAEQIALKRADQRADDEGRTLDPGDDPLIGAFETRATILTNIEDRLQTDLKKLRDDAALEEIQRAKATTLFLEQKENEKLAIIKNTLGQAAALFEEDTVAYKALATAQALINTYLAATAAFASGSKINVAFGAIAAGIAVAAGLANVAKINGIEFAEGGWTGPGEKMKAVGIVHADEYVTPKRVKNMPQAQPHLAALEQMRIRGYADGGLVTNSISQPINQQLELANIVRNLPSPVVSVKEINKGQRRVRVKESISKR